MPHDTGLRVAIDATPLLGRRTGVGAFVAGALPALAAHGGLTLSAFALSLRGGPRLPEVLPPGVRPLRRPMPASALLATWARVDHPPVERWTGPVDVVHGTNFVSPPARDAAEVVTVHDLVPLNNPDLAAPATRSFPALVDRAVRRGAFVHTPSAFVAAALVDLLGIESARVQAIHHGLPAAPDEVARSPVAGPYVLAIGRVEPRKALPTLVAAFDAVAAIHRDLRLVVAGPLGFGEVALAEAIEGAAHGSRVIRLGWVEPSQAAGLLRAAAVLAYPSLDEGFGFPPLEAMAVGVPVVASRAGALPEVLGDGAHFVTPGDAASLGEGLAMVLADDEIRQGLVDRGRRRAASFSWEACAAGLADLYRRAAGGR